MSIFKVSLADVDCLITRLKVAHEGDVARYRKLQVSDWRNGRSRGYAPGFCLTGLFERKRCDGFYGWLLLEWPTVDFDTALNGFCSWKQQEGRVVFKGVGRMARVALSFGDHLLDMDATGSACCRAYEKKIREVIQEGHFPAWNTNGRDVWIA